MAEELLVAKHRRQSSSGRVIPLVVLRASIMAASLAEPVPGWTDSLGFLGGCYALAGHGILHEWPLNPKLIGDQIPVDLAANQLLAALMVCRKTFEEGQSAFLLTHACSSSANGVTWGEAATAVETYLRTEPFEHGVPWPRIKAIANAQLYDLNFKLKRQLPYMAYYRLTSAIGTKSMAKKG